MATRTLHPFPARMAPEVALDAIPEVGDTQLTIIDPMCGSGTVLGVAVARGHNAVGEDIDPLAVMMSTLAVSPINASALEAAAHKVVQQARRSEGVPAWGDDAETNRFVDFWFGQIQKRQLIALTHAISQIEDDVERLALRVALSRIIVTKSPKASLAADTSHSRPHRVKETSDYDVIAGFAQSVTELTRTLVRRQIRGVAQVALGDARVLSSVDDASADIAVTSPPYLNALDYLRGHRLALVWFGYRIAELRTRRADSIGAERGRSDDAPAVVMEMVDVIKRSAANPDALRIPMLERFALDCVGFALQLRRTLKPGATAVLVVGNSTLRGNYIQNDLIARRAMEHAGFHYQSQKEREIPPSQRYMAINTSDKASSMAKRMRTEVVLTMGR
ncbi:hypothetical protein G5T42_11725 [Microbacterium sp. 4R-513]|uniref:hypothetical protein n=1 Tax=Microbacterium sp. 4R-513 TaxID=2567934 RepID=UPI0013E17F28|nr:hypothetical protein [Microbacterium sp. 4R-513]QIG40067.1 hypothetical protein G5T42_11725 [Microbacterium sp. 4R-513]